MPNRFGDKIRLQHALDAIETTVYVYIPCPKASTPPKRSISPRSLLRHDALERQNYRLMGKNE
jgi:hypothetical protein